MRHGHCKQLLCNISRIHGRASFSRSIHGKPVSKGCRSESQSWAYQKHRNKFNFKTTAHAVDDDPWQDAFQWFDAQSAIEEICWDSLLGSPASPLLAYLEHAEQEQLHGPRESTRGESQGEPESEKKRQTLWEEGQARATRVANIFAANFPLPKHAEGVTAPLVTSKDRSPATPPLYPAFASPPPQAGGPPAPEEHDCAREVAARVCKGMSDAPWMSRKNRVETTKIAAGSSEYNAVVDYFLRTVAAPDISIVELRRVQNLPVYARYRPMGSETVMFHGCQSQANEDSIIRDGFQVSCCRSGGKGFGSWFAYGAAYSNGGYAFQDSDGVRHIFVCMVSYNHTVMDNYTMRVVGQDCAYPLWLLKYKRPPNSFAHRAVAVSSRRAADNIFYVVRDGEWVPENAKVRCRK